jgi:hypothetical protein
MPLANVIAFFFSFVFVALDLGLLHMLCQSPFFLVFFGFLVGNQHLRLEPMNLFIYFFLLLLFWMVTNKCLHVIVILF